jgi:hypothetical protein
MAFRQFAKNNSETVRVTANTFQGHDLIDIRIYAKNFSTGEVGPTRKGISLNVDVVPELINALTWALGQQCDPDPASPERLLEPQAAERLASATWQALRNHGSAVHWDSIERMVLSDLREFSKWDLHYVLASRKDLFEWAGNGCFRARKDPRP